MSVTFAVPDLHGRADCLEAALQRIAQDAPGGGTVVFLGDYIDRGPRSRDVLERLMAGPPAQWRWIALKGNHEDMMAQCVESGRLSWWLGNGGDATLADYGGAIPRVHLEWAGSLPFMHRDAHRVYVHAGIDPRRPIGRQDPHDLLWLRYAPGEDVSVPGLHVVHGHTPNPKGPELYAGRSNLDSFAYATGRLTVARFDDALPGGPQRVLEIVI